MKLKVNDNVQVISGKDRGKQGKILGIFDAENKISVAGINLTKRHVKKSQRFPQGGRVELPAKINASNVMVVCPNCKKLTRIAYHLDKKTKDRICKKCGKGLIVKESK